MTARGIRGRIHTVEATGVRSIFMLHACDKCIPCGYSPHVQGSIAPAGGFDTSAPGRGVSAFKGGRSDVR